MLWKQGNRYHCNDRSCRVTVQRVRPINHVNYKRWGFNGGPETDVNFPDCPVGFGSLSPRLTGCFLSVKLIITKSDVTLTEKWSNVNNSERGLLTD